MSFSLFLPIAGNAVNIFLLLSRGAWWASCRASSGSAVAFS